MITKTAMRIIYAGLLSVLFCVSAIAQNTGSIGGQVQDISGSVIPGASVTVVSATGVQKSATTNQSGEFLVPGLAAGTYTVKVIAPNFGLYENSEVVVEAGKREQLTVPLSIAEVKADVDVSADQDVSTESEAKAGATVLKGKDLDALPDDPDELAAALQALAGPGAGPDGGQIYIDGFTGGRMPPKDSIREVRVNQNPFSAEFSRIGFGRIEILTKPGSDNWRGEARANFNDAALNSRNPFAVSKAPSRNIGITGNIAGPLQKGKSSFFLDVENRVADTNTVINAIVLNPDLTEVAFQQEVQVPTRRFSIGPRFDYQIGSKNTLIARYNFSRGKSENQGLGALSLPSRAYDSSNSEHELRLTETMIVSPSTVNETRFSFDVENREQLGDNSIPSINVGSAFSGGGAQIGNSFNRSRGWELQNYTTTSFGKNSEHGVKFGVQINSTTVRDRSENNFGGSFTFIDLDNYRDTILGRDHPIQFSILAGRPEQSVSQTDVGAFITHDWKVRTGLSLSLGVRYENQTNIDDKFNFAPRLAVAWSPGASGKNSPSTVFRGGFGVFYDRFGQNLVLQSRRFNGVEQVNLVVNAMDPDPVRRAAAIALLDQIVFTSDSVSNVPTADQIQAALPQSNAVRTIARNLQAPYLMQGAIGVEHQFPLQTTVSVTFITSRQIHGLRVRNVNSPVCLSQLDCTAAVRPDPAGGDVYEYESSGRMSQNQFVTNFRSRFHRRVSLFGNYRLGFTESDSDGAGSFPAYTYDLSGEYGRSSMDIRHNFTIGGQVGLPFGISMSPFLMVNSGRPFNFTRGIDSNGDSQFTERPTFAEIGARCLELGLTNDFCSIDGLDPNAIVPRNYGNGPSYFSMNLRLRKNFAFGEMKAGAGRRGRAGGGGGRRMGGGGGMFGGGGGGMDDFDGERGRYNLGIGMNVTNLLNTVNYGAPVGNVSSSRFGLTTSTGGGFGGFGGGRFGGGGGSTGSANRRVELYLEFSW
jgi:hypothetical protein